MTYFTEFRQNWRVLAASCVGLGGGYQLSHFLTNIFAPHLLAEFGWSKSQFALLGLSVLVIIISSPLWGRVIDRVGAKRVVMGAIAATPLTYLALSFQNGSFAVFYVIIMAQIIFVGGTAGVLVYSRLVAGQFSAARGTALGLIACSAYAVGALAAPFMSTYVEAYGWRAGYQLLAAGTGLAAITAFFLVPGHVAPGAGRHAPTQARLVYRELLRNRAFRIIVVGMVLCNLTLSIQSSQIKVMLLDLGVNSNTGSVAISLYGVGVIAGRILCGVALDRLPAHIVSAVALSLPAVSFFTLASGMNSPAVVYAAILLLGFAFGSEADVGAYLTTRYFPPEVFGSVYGLVLGAFAFSGAFGALLLSGMLAWTDSYAPFLQLAAVAALIGGSGFLLLGQTKPDPTLVAASQS